MPRTGLDEFKEVVSDVKNLSSWTVAGAIAAPLLDFITRIGPPWPSGVPIITSVVELLALICIFQYWSRASSAKLKKRMLIALVMICAGFILYLVLSSFFIFDVQNPAHDRLVKGFVLREDVRPYIPKKFATAEDALVGADYDEMQIWTPWSIMTTRLSLILVWIVFFVSLTTFIGTFVIAQRRKKL